MHSPEESTTHSLESSTSNSLELLTSHSSMADGDGDVYLPEHKVLEPSTATSLDDNIALPSTEQEETGPSTPIDTDYLLATSNGHPTIHIPQIIPVTPSTIPNTSIVQKIQSPRFFLNDTSDASSTVQASSPHSSNNSSRSPSFPPTPLVSLSPLRTSPNIHLPLDNAITFRACSNIRDVLYHEARSPNLIALLRTLATDLFQLTKDGLFIFQFYRGMQVVREEHAYAEVLRCQLLAIKRVVQTTSNILASICKDPAHYNLQTDTASQCRRDIGSIKLDAEASITVIMGFFAQLEEDCSSASFI